MLFFLFNFFSQDRVMVSLTAMLVLVSFFSKTSEYIPRTSYLKLIDIWFVFLITYNFGVIISMVIIEKIRFKTMVVQEKENFKSCKTSKDTPNWKTKFSEKMNDVSKLFFMFILVAFMIYFLKIAFV